MGGIHAHQVRGTWEHFAPCINANVSHQRKTKQRKGNSSVVFGKNQNQNPVYLNHINIFFKKLLNKRKNEVK